MAAPRPARHAARRVRNRAPSQAAPGRVAGHDLLRRRAGRRVVRRRRGQQVPRRRGRPCPRPGPAPAPSPPRPGRTSPTGRRPVRCWRPARTPPTPLAALTGGDDQAEQRQAGVVEPRPTPRPSPAPACIDWAGGIADGDVAIQGNILTGPEVVEAMHAAWQDARRRAAGRAAAGGAGCRRRGWRRPPRPPVRGAATSSRRAPATAATTPRSTCASTTTRTRCPSWPGCWSCTGCTSTRRTRPRLLPLEGELAAEVRGAAGPGRAPRRRRRRRPGVVGRRRELRGADAARQDRSRLSCNGFGSRQ